MSEINVPVKLCGVGFFSAPSDRPIRPVEINQGMELCEVLTGGKVFFEQEGERLYERVLRKSQEWGNDRNMMYVVGATKADMLEGIRKIVPEHFLLVPGVGAQGGSLEEVARYGMNNHCGLIVNSSRGIIFADKTENFARRAGEEARKLQADMERLLAGRGIVD